MPNTYTQLYIHIIFAVQGRANLISEQHKEELQKYITGIIRNREQKLLAISCMPDHCHIFISMRPKISVSDLVRDIKAGSSGFINKKNWMKGKFNWQAGFGAFSYGSSQIDRVIDYINNQEMHHSRSTFRDEYIKLLEKFLVDYDTKYLFDWYD